jgi:hypothetical protein
MDGLEGDGRPAYFTDDLVGLILEHKPQLMWRYRFLLNPEARALTEEAVEKSASTLPRAAEATDEEHYESAYAEIFRRYLAHSVDDARRGK